jgi:hypothetical protein
MFLKIISLVAALVDGVVRSLQKYPFSGRIFPSGGLISA